jgi:cytochrome b6-f complex iron-sulfur subunit
MKRKEFIAKLGIGAAFVLTTNCLQSCTKDSAADGPVDFTLDLKEAANATLAINGNYIVTNGVVVARANDGSYVAATVTCSHDNQKKVTYDKDTNQYYCTAHGAEFDLAGKGKNSLGNKGLTIYKTTLTGTTLRVYS